MLKKLLLQKTDQTSLQFVRYLFVGGIAAMVDTAVVVFIAEVALLHYQLATVTGFVFGIVVNYLLSHSWVFGRIFHDCKAKDHARDFFAFMLIGIIGLLLTLLLMWIFHDLLSLSVLVSKLLSLVVVFWNFFARKYLVFQKRTSNI